MTKSIKVQTKFEQVYDYITHRIEKDMAVGDRFLTETELANLLKVNRMTVAKAMSVLKSQGYVDRKPGMGTIVIRKPNKNEKDGIITVLPYVNIASMKDEYFSKLFSAICLNCLNKELTNVCVGSKTGNQKAIDLERIARLYFSEEHQGIIMMDPRKQGVNEWLNYFKDLKAVVVWVGMSANISDKINCIDSDNIKGAIDAVQYLFELGHKRIGFLSRELDITPIEDRLYGFEKAHKEKGIVLDRNRVVIVKKPKSSKEAGYRGIKVFIEKRIKVDALFVVGQGLLYGIEEARKEHPDKSIFRLPIVTFDYELPGQFENVIASVIEPVAKMGKLAVKIINEIHKGNLKQPVRKLLKVKLVKRAERN